MADDGNRLRTTSFVDPAQAQADKDFDPLAGAMDGMNVSDIPEGKMTTVKAEAGLAAQPIREDIQYGPLSVIGNGSFGVVFKTTIADSKGRQNVALKKVLQDRRYKNRELEIMREVMHRNIVVLKWFFHTPGQKNEVYLNLVMEFVPTSLSSFAESYAKRKMQMPVLYVKLSIYQMFRALAYLHGRGICHRDIKPQNLLLNVSQGVLKLCDFGCAKVLQVDQGNVSYICSRYYRAPELCLGATFYSHAIDVWSGGCVMAELLMNRPIFRGSKSSDQMEKIMRVLGAPRSSEIRAMNPDFRRELKTASVHSLAELLRSRPADERELEVEMLMKVFQYKPKQRPHSIETLADPFFDELRDPSTVLPNGQPLPELFDFTREELVKNPDILGQLQKRA
eukprot:m.23164 g.23164  ORF g.23164 m.23164 type:complete len:394 (+) comp11343_c0_seq1:148-1329(+)